MFRHLRIHVVLLLLCTNLCAPRLSIGCAIAPPLGSIVEIADESAVIIWDEATNTQHFIRRAGFRSNSEDFGFLVPVPSIPELYEAKDSSFGRLEDMMRPELVAVPVHGIKPVSLLFGFFFMTSSRDMVTAPAPQVRVLISKTVSGYDAVVLEADDSAALVKWLTENDYHASDMLLEWFDPYVQNKWKIAAFKISSNGEDVATSPVRMSFKTDAPYFPYREPANTGTTVQDQPRLLRLFVISSNRVEGRIGSGTTEWPGKVKWSDRISEQTIAGLSEDFGLQPAGFPQNSWMTVFEDESSVRPGMDDLYFKASSSQERILPPPITYESDRRTPIPLELIPFLIGVFLFIFWRKKPART